MVQKHLVISMIAPVAVAAILTLAILAAISSTNQAFAYSSYSYKSYKGHQGYYKSYRYTKHGNVRASNTGNEAQGASNTGAKPTSLSLSHSFYQACCKLMGHLESEGKRVAGATITLGGSAGVPTLSATTDSNGNYNFNFKGLSRGTHTFEAHFAGNSQYGPSEKKGEFPVAYT